MANQRLTRTSSHRLRLENKIDDKLAASRQGTDSNGEQGIDQSTLGYIIVLDRLIDSNTSICIVYDNKTLHFFVLSPIRLVRFTQTYRFKIELLKSHV
jgi:hypothetical protein